jgi:uncharacterized protein
MPKTVACPHCGRPVVWGEESPYRPFCSARCRLIDLGDWLDERYRIPDISDAPSEDTPPPQDSTQPH